MKQAPWKAKFNGHLIPIAKAASSNKIQNTHNMPYIVGEDFFKTKDALTERARLALSRTPNGQPAGEEDTEFLIALFQHHDEWDEKSSGGIRDISTQTTAHGTRCFILRKHDGTEIDISFPHAIRLIPTTRKQEILPQALRDFKSAARSAIKPQIDAFREQAFRQPQQCPLSGEKLSRSNAAVDHEPPITFDALIFKFCKENSVNPLEVRVGSEGGVVAVFEDQNLLKSWQSFHRNHANLRIVSNMENLKLPKTKVIWTELWSLRDTDLNPS